jgi:cation:H+ antiporter
MPEFVVSFLGALNGNADVAIGNVVGSNIFNVLGILGITPLIAPLKNSTLAPMDFGVMLFCTLILLPMMRSGWKLSRWEGALLLYIYVAYTVWLLLPLF